MTKNFAQNEYDALTIGVGFAQLPKWTQIEISGADRLKFLNNFCTADLGKLSPNQGSEAFICNVKGKVLGHVFILNDDDRLYLVTVPGQADTLIPHLDRYTLRDDVTLRDASAEGCLLQISGAQAEASLTKLCASVLPERPLESREGLVAERATLVTRGLFGTNSFLLRTANEHASMVGEQLRAVGAIQCDAAALEAVRIEAGVPLFGRDITNDNLPQEVNRNVQAISFTKGCYLGQETVARIDALGHVNRLLVGVQVYAESIPTPGEKLLAEGREVGQITSAAFSPRLATPLALAYVHSSHAEAGTKLAIGQGDAQVIELPLT